MEQSIGVLNLLFGRTEPGKDVVVSLVAGEKTNFHVVLQWVLTKEEEKQLDTLLSKAPDPPPVVYLPRRNGKS